MSFTPVDGDTQAKILQFVLYETHLLDSALFKDWLELLTQDFTYKIPVPFTPADPTSPPRRDDVLILDETRDSLANLWFRRFEHTAFEDAWGENPRQRTRRFVTNTLVSAGDEQETFIVRSNLLLSFVRQSDPATLVPAGRIDTVRLVGGALKLARRVVHLDQTVLTTTHMRLIF